MVDYRITFADVQKARKAFQANEPRDLFYRAATELVDLALRRKTSLTVAEALAVLLQTWNSAYYLYQCTFDNAHFASIEKLLATHHAAMRGYRKRTIGDLDHGERSTVAKSFEAFEKVLGPVGAAKALHLLAPGFFPIWDRTIAQKYGQWLGPAGSNGKKYWRFMAICQRQCRELKNASCTNPLKSIDEYNYCKYTKRWLR